MKTVNVAELEGLWLDWSVAKAVGLDNPRPIQMDRNGYSFLVTYGEWQSGDYFSPSTDWSQGGPLIESHEIQVSFIIKAPSWMAMCKGTAILAQTPLIATCRAIVAAKFGDTVEVPEELL